MTYHWIVPAPELDSGAKRRIKNIFIICVFKSELLTSYSATTELYIFFCILFYKNIVPIGALY